MACYHPNIMGMQENGIIKKDGRAGTRTWIEAYYHQVEEWGGYEHIIEKNEMMKSYNEECPDQKIKFVMTPCGTCIGCRTKERKDWSLRIEKEAAQYKHNYFVTLTFDNEHLVIPDKVPNTKTGEIYERTEKWKGTVNKRDLELFNKNLKQIIARKYYEDGTEKEKGARRTTKDGYKNIKYYECAEYGDLHARPHYHCILMNMPKLKKEIIKDGVRMNGITKHGYFTNQLIEQAWGYKGQVTIGEVNWDTISYVAGYCQKKLFGDKGAEIYAKNGQMPIFNKMSKSIGKQYFLNNKDEIYKTDEVINGKGQSLKPPSYFDRLMDAGEEDSIVLKDIKEQRFIIGEMIQKAKCEQTTLPIKEQLLVDERTALEKYKNYNRDRIITRVAKMST